MLAADPRGLSRQAPVSARKMGHPAFHEGSRLGGIEGEKGCGLDNCPIHDSWLPNTVFGGPSSQLSFVK